MTSLLHWQSFNNKCRLSNNRCCRCSRPSKISKKLLKKQLRTPREKSVNKEHDRLKSVNSIDDLAAKVDQMLKGNQSQVFIMEEAPPEKSAGDLAFDVEISGDDQQEQDKPADPSQSNQGQYARKSQKEREPTVGTNSPGPEQPAEAVRPIPELVHAREYTPKVPYPIPARATRKDREEMKCRKMLEDLTVRLPLMDAIQMMPSMRSFMKGMISGKISEESEFMTVSKECSVVLQNRQIKKRGDLGKPSTVSRTLTQTGMLSCLTPQGEWEEW
ncbi:hypothetical protein F2Q70_00004230 [Brassica cretica]|uniref:Uncharacterized protein n=1 Tax=Brassica cretica TaxID=69181 RepID=A0A8S9IRC7_BRACR|nr:hypothetical protein F2Q70_00004230 [Brassica cretica]